MISENAKKELYKQCNTYFKGYDLKKMIQALEKAIDVPIQNEQLNGLDKNLSYAINRIYGNASRLMDDDLDIITDYFFKIENFVKKILYIVDVEAYEELKQEKKLTCGYILDKLHLLDDAKDKNGRINFTPKEIYRSNTNYLYYILQAYDLRNETTHEARERTWVQLFTNIENVMVAELYISWKFHKHIDALFDSNEISQIIDAKQYCKKIAKDYEARIKDGFSFVPIIWQREIGAGNSQEPDSGLSMDSMEKLFQKRKHIMLRGDAGCGKTTSVEYLEYKDAKRYLDDENSAIPILLRLSEYSDTEFDIEASICEKLNISRNAAQRLLEKKALNIYLDGVNEIILSTEQKSDVVIKIENFMRKHTELQIVVTDRKYVEIELEMSIMTFFLKQMQKKDIALYLSSKVKKQEIVDRILDYVEEAGFEGINATPLVLDFLIETCMQDKGLPENATEFYLAYIKHLINREYMEKKDIAAAPGRLDILLLYLALNMPEDGFSMVQILKNFTQCRNKLGIEKIDNVHCLKLAVQLGILENQGEIYRFANENYLDCLFAEAVEKGLDELDD